MLYLTDMSYKNFQIKILCLYLPHELAFNIVEKYKCYYTPSCSIMKPLIQEYINVLNDMKASKNLTCEIIFPTIRFCVAPIFNRSKNKNSRSNNELFHASLSKSEKYIHVLRVDFDDKFWWIRFIRHIKNNKIQRSIS